MSQIELYESNYVINKVKMSQIQLQESSIMSWNELKWVKLNFMSQIMS